MRIVIEGVEAILRRSPGKKTCSSPLQTATLELMGLADTYWPQAHSDPEMMARLSAAAHEFGGIPSLRIPFDICVEAEAIGCEVRMGRADTPPSIMNPAFTEFDELRIPNLVQERGRIPTLLRATRLLSGRDGNSIPSFTMIVGPVTLLGFLVGIEKTLYTLSTQPQALEDALYTIPRVNVSLADGCVSDGSDFVLVADPVASGDLVAAKHFARYILPLYQRIRRQLKVKSILHICA